MLDEKNPEEREEKKHTIIQQPPHRQHSKCYLFEFSRMSHMPTISVKALNVSLIEQKRVGKCNQATI